MDRFTPMIEGKQSVDSLEKVMLDQVEQWVLLRGENINNPVILFLHGGPGNAQIGWAPEYQTSLEKDFIVVNWDQRGAGLSYNDSLSEESMNIENFVHDAHELTRYLIYRFKKDKIFVVGHSWGSIIGMLLAQKYPDLIYAYVGVGQSVHLQRGELLSYNFTVDFAKRNELQKATSELKAIGHPPYKTLNDLFIQRKWLTEFGGVVYKDTDFFKRTVHIIQKRSEYKETDIDKLNEGNTFSMRVMWDEVMTVNLLDQIKDVNCPVYFLLGEFDFNTPNLLVQEFYSSLTAPIKETIFFSGVAHNLPFEEPGLFHKTMYDISLNYT
ncbi:alpha/beta hydrolase [Virgibacillus salexigens]|uniref:alpha/beta hydrolase n=1 Tax=Virgibacillus salexigens TaxID=61016 RepID=UPI001909D104|nr:alpha/beta hydrolase [Virgibacillus salexigens]